MLDTITQLWCKCRRSGASLRNASVLRLYYSTEAQRLYELEQDWLWYERLGQSHLLPAFCLYHLISLYSLRISLWTGAPVTTALAISSRAACEVSIHSFF